MNQIELAAIGRQFAILCTEREQLFGQLQEMKGQLDAANKELDELKKKHAKKE